MSQAWAILINSRAWFKQGHEVMEAKHNFNMEQWGDVGLGYITHKLIYPYLHDEGLVFCQHLFIGENIDNWCIVKDFQCFHIQQATSF